jgi:CheY-like chemotaxis protein
MSIEPPNEPIPIAQGIRRVLVVEDDADSSDLLVELLTGRGLEIRAAGTAEDALVALTTSLADVVLLDIGLPDADGYAVARTIRERFGHAIRLIALTGFTSLADVEDAVAAGFDSFLCKPYALEELKKLLAHDAMSAEWP